MIRADGVALDRSDPESLNVKDKSSSVPVSSLGALLRMVL